jgi:HSP20 family molecular chaperone IbpA
MALKDIINWFTGSNADEPWPNGGGAPSSNWPKAPTSSFGRRQQKPEPKVRMELTADSKPDATAETFFADARREMERMREEFSKDTGGLRMPPGTLARAMEMAGLKVEEVGSDYHVTIELPGFVEKDVAIEPRERLLIVRAEQRSEQTSNRDDSGLTQRFANKLERIVSLSSPIDPAKVTSTFTGGVLHVTLPKQP